MTQHFTARTEDGKDCFAELQGFANGIGLEEAAPGRYSFLLVLGLFGSFKAGVLNPAKVVHEIRALEGIGPPSQLKPPIQNRHQPLKGLWHKHYMEDGIRSTAMNVQKGLDRHGMRLFEQRIREAEAADEERYLSAEDVPALVNDMIGGNLERLAAAEALTGEWIMFAQHEGRNYYLCLATHEHSTHDHIRRQIDAVCCVEFPFLSSVIARMTERGWSERHTSPECLSKFSATNSETPAAGC
jgi:hypothetical protein